MSYAARPEYFDRILKQTMQNIETISLGVLEQTTGKELSTVGDTELKGADYLAWYMDLEARGVLSALLEIQEDTDWVAKWSEKFDREAAKLGLI